MNKETELFHQGIEAFNKRSFYDAHEYWEEIWLNYKLEDATFIQGLIQLSVSYFHYFNGNIKGARSMIRKCLTKFDMYESARGIDIKQLKIQINDLKNQYDDMDVTYDNIDIYIITLKVIHE